MSGSDRTLAAVILACLLMLTPSARAQQDDRGGAEGNLFLAELFIASQSLLAVESPAAAGGIAGVFSLFMVPEDSQSLLCWLPFASLLSLGVLDVVELGKDDRYSKEEVFLYNEVGWHAWVVSMKACDNSEGRKSARLRSTQEPSKFSIGTQVRENGTPLIVIRHRF